MEFELLFYEFSAPLPNRVFFDKPETRALVQLSCPVQPFECPEKHLPVTGFTAEPYGPVYEKTSKSPAVKFGIDDEPAEARAFAACLRPVNGRGARKGPVHNGSPEAVPVLAEIADEIRQLSSNLNFKGNVKASVFVIVNGMEFRDFSDDAGVVTRQKKFFRRVSFFHALIPEPCPLAMLSLLNDPRFFNFELQYLNSIL